MCLVALILIRVHCVYLSAISVLYIINFSFSSQFYDFFCNVVIFPCDVDISNVTSTFIQKKRLIVKKTKIYKNTQIAKEQTYKIIYF